MRFNFISLIRIWPSSITTLQISCRDCNSTPWQWNIIFIDKLFSMMMRPNFCMKSYQSIWDPRASNASPQISLFGVNFGLALSKVSYFFENNVGYTKSTMNTIFWWPELDDVNTNYMWFQKKHHTAHATLNILHKRSELIISHGSNVNWSQKSCNLTPSYFCSEGLLKSQLHVYKLLTTFIKYIHNCSLQLFS